LRNAIICALKQVKLDLQAAEQCREEEEEAQEAEAEEAEAQEAQEAQ
jgi:hypothetical protein